MVHVIKGVASIYLASLNSSEVTTLKTKLDEFNTFLKDAGRQLVVVEFSANWCGFCKEKCSVFHDMPLQYQNVRFAIVDVDDSPELADACHIKAVPTFQIFKKIQKETVFSRIKATLCCNTSEFMAEQIFEFYGMNVKRLEEKIQQFIGPARLSNARSSRFSRDFQRCNSSQ
uniref:thioredoxin domain-containing protein 8 isoform X2 n=1 Tax=Ictidomys tridecemlineatus TaxID=43179 RepID=UPI001A9D1C8D|nr:thioredoxin domain-containing protein 8 isoform X2 [Ictidomys tridecemlineatus]